jgi:hypothetical protein
MDVLFWYETALRDRTRPKQTHPKRCLVAKSDPSASARARAFALAASGDYLLWPNIAQVLTSEGFSAATIKQIGKDREAQREITKQIHAAERARPAAVAETRHTRWRKNG